jgi:hypothetical protein
VNGNTQPERTLARLKDFVRRGGCLIVLDDSRIGQRGSAKGHTPLLDWSTSRFIPGDTFARETRYPQAPDGPWGHA